MRKVWRIDGHGITATATMANAVAAASALVLPGASVLPIDERRRRLLVYLTQSMAAAITKAILENGDTNQSLETIAGDVE